MGRYMHALVGWRRVDGNVQIGINDVLDDF